MHTPRLQASHFGNCSPRLWEQKCQTSLLYPHVGWGRIILQGPPVPQPSLSESMRHTISDGSSAFGLREASHCKWCKFIIPFCVVQHMTLGLSLWILFIYYSEFSRLSSNNWSKFLEKGQGGSTFSEELHKKFKMFLI